MWRSRGNGPDARRSRLLAGRESVNAGSEDQIDNHWGALFKAALLSTILSVGSEAGTSLNSENSLVDAIRRGKSDYFSQTGLQVVGRWLQV